MADLSASAANSSSGELRASRRKGSLISDTISFRRTIRSVFFGRDQIANAMAERVRVVLDPALRLPKDGNEIRLQILGANCLQSSRFVQTLPYTQATQELLKEFFHYVLLAIKKGLRLEALGFD